MLSGRDCGRVDVTASAAAQAAREICRMASGAGPMKEMVQLPFMRRHARGLLDELCHLTRLGDKSGMRAVDSFRLGFHPIGHESLRLRGYPVVLFRNEIPRGNCLPAGGCSLFLKRGTSHWALGDSHHICHVSWCIRAESLVKLVSLDVQLWPAAAPGAS